MLKLKTPAVDPRGGVGPVLQLLPAIGPFQADVALNPTLDEDERRRWRIALYVMPWSMTLYRHRYVRR